MEQSFEKNIISYFGDSGKKWLENLPLITKNVLIRWSIKNHTICSNLSYNYIVFGQKDNVDVCVKISYSKEEFNREAKVLEFFEKQKINCFVKILDIDLENQAMLLERISPGNTLKDFFPESEEPAAEIFSNLLNQLKKQSNQFNVNVSLPKVSEYLEFVLAKKSEDFHKYIDKSTFKQIYFEIKNRFKNYIFLKADELVLHGDLHHLNILASHQDWMIIDPKGVIGPIEFEAGSFLYNPSEELFAHPNRTQIMFNRINLIAKKINSSEKTILKFFLLKLFLTQIWCWEVKNSSKHYLLILDLINHKK